MTHLFSLTFVRDSQQLPEEAATIAAYDELLKMSLSLQQQEYSQRREGNVCFPADDTLTGVRSRITRPESLWTPACTLLPSRSWDQLASEVQGSGLQRNWNGDYCKLDPNNHSYAALENASEGHASRPAGSPTMHNVKEWIYHLWNGLRALEGVQGSKILMNKVKH